VLKALETRSATDAHLDAERGDVTVERDVRVACRGADSAVHLAGVSSVEACRKNPRAALDVNGYAVRTLLENLRDPGLFVYPSSVAGMYTDEATGKVTEETPVEPVNDYGVSKLLGETYCRAYREAPTLVFRQSNVYGPSPSGYGDGVVRQFVERAVEGKPLTVYGSGEQVRDFIHIDDLVRAYVTAIEDDAVGTLNLVTGTSTEINELVETVRRHAPGVEVEHEELPEGERKVKGYEVSNEKASDALDWSPKVSLEDGVKDLFEAMTEAKSD